MNTLTRRRIGLVFGGASSEHSVSCVTAKGVAGAIDLAHFEVVPIGITKSGEFYRVEINPDWMLSDDPEVRPTDSQCAGSSARPMPQSLRVESGCHLV